MQNSNTIPSTSVSPVPPADASAAAGGVRLNGSGSPAVRVEESLAPPASRPAAAPPQADRPQATQPAPTPLDALPQVDKSAFADVHRVVAERPRSLRLSLRFWRVVVHFGWLFVQVVFWHMGMARYFPEQVERGNIARWRSYARAFRRFAIELGGVMIKAGQFVSTRSDILPEEVTNELISLRDEVPSVPLAQIKAILQRELGDLAPRFSHFDEQAIAAASLGQVHRARLHNGEKVVIKVQRPGIAAICYTDLAAMFVVARIANRFRFIRRRMDAVALIDEFGRILLEELSYKHEAQNAARFASMFADDLGVYVPQIYHEHSTDCVLVMEDVTTIKLNDFAALDRAGISRLEVARRLMDTYLRQIFEQRFFHADPHPGNLFVYPLPENSAAYAAQVKRISGRPFYLIFIDFGMIGTLTPQIVDGLIGTMAAVATRDSRKLIASYSELGLLLPSADQQRLAEATEAVFSQVWGMNMVEMRDIDFDQMSQIGEQFNDLLFSMPFQVPQDFIYLGRTVGILSGLATSLDPSFNPWSEMQPYTAQLLTMRASDGSSIASSVFGGSVLQGLFNGDGARTLINIGQSLLGGLVPNALAQPDAARQAMSKLERGDVKVQIEPTAAFEHRFAKLEMQERRTTRAVLVGVGTVTGAILLTGGQPVLGVAFFLFGGAMYATLLLTEE